MHIVDCKGLKCPTPVINTKKYFDSIENGSATIIVDNEVAKNNIVKFCESNGYKSDVKDKENNFEITITKESCGCEVMDFNKQSSCIVVASDKLGEGDDTLGTTLMKSYLFALSESDNLPTDLVFMNGGVKLVVNESPCLESILKLQERGVKVTSCGTCLDFFKIKDQLAVGEISNMYAIVDLMNKASNTIKL